MEKLDILEPTEYLNKKKYGYFSILTEEDNGKRQYSYKLKSIDEVLAKIDITKDTWISQGQFIKPNRRVVNLARIGLLFVDLDTYQSEVMNGLVLDKQINLLYYTLEQLEIPKPSIVIHSGRGLQLKWILEYDIPRKALPRWNLLQKILVEKLKHLGADTKAKDAARVLRVVSSINSKSNKEVFIVDKQLDHRGKITKYNFEYLAEILLPVLRSDLFNKNDNRVQKSKDKVVLSRKALNPMKLAWNRLEDLRTLSKIRGGVNEGERMHHLFWRINFLLLSGATHSENMYHEAVVLANELDPKWDYQSRELITLYMRAKEFEKGNKVRFLGKDYSPLYTPKNGTLIDIFQIKPEEEVQLSTIISKAEKNRRNSIAKKIKRRKEGAIERDIYLRKKEVRKEKAISLKKKGLKIDEISAVLKCSRRTVFRYLESNKSGANCVPTTNMA